jgi:hypothetical protein
MHTTDSCELFEERFGCKDDVLSNLKRFTGICPTDDLPSVSLLF